MKLEILVIEFLCPLLHRTLKTFLEIRRFLIKNIFKYAIVPLIMKLITLNAWGGKLYEPLMEFIKKNKDVDVFCFQDVLFGNEPVFSPIKHGRINLFKEIEKVLTDHKSVISKEEGHSTMEGEELSADVGSGKVIFYKNNLTMLSHGGLDVADTYRTETMINSQCQWIEFDTGLEKITVLNLHGMWQRASQKQDTEERLEQSRRIANFMKGLQGKRILGRFQYCS